MSLSFPSRKRALFEAPGDGAPAAKAARCASVLPPGDAPPPLPPGSATPPLREAVQVEPLIKRVYGVVHERSFLDWGLTSDWVVGEGRTRGAAAACASPAAAAAPGAAKDGNAASEGYGEVTEGSLQRVLNHLAELRVRATEAGGEEAAAALHLGPAHDLCAESTLVDVGSGYGKVVFHAALSGLFASCEGVEYVASRHHKAASVLADLRSGALTARLGACCDAAALTARLRSTRLRCGDATAAPLHFTHVYMYDKVFSDATSAALAVQLNRSRYRVLVSYRPHASWQALGLRGTQEVGHLVMRTTGGQNFRVYFLANTRDWTPQAGKARKARK